jgi:TPR repeat protein
VKMPATVGLAFALAIGLSGLTGRAGEARASSLNDAQSQDRAEFVLLLRKARHGDSDAQWSAAMTYLRLGEPGLAMPLLDSAAASGHVLAISQLGALHEEGRGVEKSREKALEWYRKAAEQGDPASMAALARLLPRSDPQAVEFRLRSAGAGNPDAQYALGLDLLGRGDEKALAESHAWFLKAAEQGHVGAQVAVGQQFLEGKAVKGSADQGRTWLQRAARSGDPAASFMLAVSTLPTGFRQRSGTQVLAIGGRSGASRGAVPVREAARGSEALPDKREAARWLEKAWLAGHIVAANRLGELLRELLRVLQQPARARELFSKRQEKAISTPCIILP